MVGTNKHKHFNKNNKDQIIPEMVPWGYKHTPRRSKGDLKRSKNGPWRLNFFQGAKNGLGAQKNVPCPRPSGPLVPF